MRRFLLLCIVVLLALTVPIGGVGWKYKHKKPPGKRPKPKGPATFYIQVDPLRVVKTFNDPDVKVGPNIILAMDTSMRMQYDFDGVYYDQRAWDKEAKFIASQEPNPTAIAATLGVSSAARYYRRMYKNLYRKELNTNPVTSEYYADRIDVVDDQSPDFLSFHDVTRLGMARDGLYQAITENLYITNWGLQDMRHGQNDKLPDQPGNEQPVFLSDQSQTNLNGDILNKKKWKVSYVLPNGRNVDANSEGSDLRVKVIEQKDASSKTAFFMMHPPDDSDQANTLLP
ncbi:MAG: hypothetical protein HYX76_01720, partial [Acidobacteria bacterium]|nr:hypothetical protein [Acidobacteriota bacterium]